MHHCSTTLGRRDIVGSLVGSCVGSEAPAARSHGQTRAVVPSLEVGWRVVDGRRGGEKSVHGDGGDRVTELAKKKLMWDVRCLISR